jgi:hypothetical protein
MSASWRQIAERDFRGGELGEMCERRHTSPAFLAAGDGMKLSGVLEAGGNKPATAMTETRLANLALQGGGAHGAFTWGVPDRVLKEPRFEIDQAAAQAIGQQLIILDVKSDRDIARLVQRGVGVLFIGSGAFTNSHRERLVALAAQHAIPARRQHHRLVDPANRSCQQAPRNVARGSPRCPGDYDHKPPAYEVKAVVRRTSPEDRL